MKIRNDNPPWRGGLNHFRHGFEFSIKPSRFNEMIELIEEMGLVQKQDYRFNHADSRFKDPENIQLNQEIPILSLLSFRSKRNALRFKLSWEECAPSQSPIIKRMVWKKITSPLKLGPIILSQHGKSK